MRSFSSFPRWVKTAVLWGGVLAVGSCSLDKVGLGPKVDITPPKVSITAPVAGQYLAGTVHVTGTATDDLKVKSVTVRYSTADGDKTSAVTLTGKTWTIDLPSGGTGLKEGQTEIDAAVTDTSGKVTNASVLVYIDNTPPTVLVNYPLSHGTVGVANDNLRPILTTNIDVKGEVYDASPVQSVVVSLLQNDGQPLPAATFLKTADGTNTFLARFPLKGTGQVQEPKLYRYQVVATDAAGNKSTWYYHSQDIYNILPPPANQTDPAVAFPTINEIGRLDTGTPDPSVPTGMHHSDLVAQRLGTGAASQWGDFQYKEINAPDIRFSSLDKTASQVQNLLGLNSVITGNLIPPAGAGSIDPSKVEVKVYSASIPPADNDPTVLDLKAADFANPPAGLKHELLLVGDSYAFTVDLKNLSPGPYYIRIWAKASGSDPGSDQAAFFIDSTAPTLLETTVGLGAPSVKTPTFSLGGTANAATGLGNITLVENGTAVPAKTYPFSGNPVNAPWSITGLPTSGADGTYNYELTLTSSAGKTSPTLYRTVTRDTLAPTVEITSLTPIVGTQTVNGTVSFTASASDSNGLGGVRYWLLPTASPQPAWTDAGSKTLTSPYADTVDTTTLTDNTGYTFWVLAQDKAGNVGAAHQNVTVNQASDKPAVALTNMDATVLTSGQAGTNLQETGAKVTGTITDDDGVDSTAITVSIDGGAAVPVTLHSADGKSTSFTYDLSGLAEGNHTLQIAAQDKSSTKGGAASVSGQSPVVWFAIDKSPPALAITSPSTGTLQRTNFTLSGTASDASGIAGPVVTVKNSLNSVVGNGAVTAGAWTFAINIGSLSDGNQTWTVTTADNYGKTTTVPFAFTVDKTAPTVAATLPSSTFTWYSGTVLSAVGTSSDANGVTKVEWSDDSTTGIDGTWTAASGTTTWTATVPLTSLSEGSQKFWIRATDAAGNLSTAMLHTFGYDAAPPTVTETAVGTSGTVGRNALYNLQGTVADSNALATLTVEQRKDGGAWVTILTQAESGTSQSWATGNTLPRDPATPSNPLLADGTYDYRVTITDVAGKTAVSLGTAQVDTTPPTVTVASPTAAQWLSGTAFQASGGASDPGTGSGVATVEYSLDGTTWNTATGTSGWSANLNLTTLGEGQKNIKVRATDKAGNVSAPTTVAFGVDQAPPSLAETTSGIPSSTLVFKNTAVTLGGTATDANGVTHVTVGYQKDGGSTVSLLDDTTDDGTWTATLPYAANHTLDGIYDVTVTATDGAGKTTVINRRVQLDTQSPTVSITAPVVSEILSGSYTIRGQVTDNGGKGVVALQYSTDNATWTDIPQSGLNWSVSGVNFAGASEGARTLYVRADDGLNAASQVSVAFNYDTAPPTISEALNTTSQVIRAATFGLSGTAADTNSLASVAITATKDGAAQGTVYSQAFSGSAPQAYSYTKTVNPAGSDDGVWSYTITATDIAGRTTVLSRTVLVDATVPNLPVINSLTAPYYDASLPVSGSASDLGSGVQTMEYSFDNATWTALTGTDSWFSTIVLSSALPTLSTDGVKTLYVRATDRAGNKRTQSATFRYDTAAPAVTENNFTAATVTSSSAIVFAGNAQDFNGGTLATPDIAVTVNGTLQAPISVASGNWTWTYPNTTEGAATVVFTATDAAGRTASVTRSVLIDKTAPTVTITSPAAADVVSGSSLTISGTASDAGSGLSAGSVEYSFDGTTWAAVDGTTNWNKTVTTTGEGAKTLYVRAHDNVNLVSTVVTVNFNVDLNPPTLAETALGGNAKKNAAFSLGGTAGDTNGLATWDNDSNPLTPQVPYVAVSVNGGAATKVTVTAGAWTLPYTPSADGTLDFAVTATDVVGKTTSVSRTVTVDMTPPTIATDGVLSGLNVSTNQVNGIMTFRFNADDAGVGLEKNGASQYVAYYTIVAHGSPDLTGTTAVTAWTAVPPAASPVFTLSFDTTSTPDGQYDLYLAVRDSIPGTPNVKVLKYSQIIDVNQDSDRPLISFDNLSVAAIHNIDNTLGKDPVLLLTLQDDDKVKVSDLQYRIDIDNDGQFTSTKDFWDGNLVGGQNSMNPDGNTNSKWEDESVWYNFDQVPASDGSLVQAKINLTGFPQGVYGIQVRVRDNTDASPWSAIYGVTTNHTWQKSGIVPFAVDFGPPALSVTSPTAGVFRNGLTLAGSTRDALGVTRVRYTFDGTTYTTVYANASPLDPIGSSALVPGIRYIITALGTTNWLSVGAGASPAVGVSFTATATSIGSGMAKVDPAVAIPFSASVDLSSLATGDWSLQVVSTDVTGADATQTVTVSVDKDAPTVTVLQPATSSVLNGTAVKVSGEATDNRKVGAVFVWSGLTTAPNPPLPSQTALPSVPNPNGLYNPGGYTQLAGTGVWNTTVDTTAQASTPANGYRIRVVAVDAVGNVGTPLDVPVTVDQQTDRPVISFSNLSLVTPSRLPAGNLTIIGTVTDDDAVNHASIQIRLDRNGDGDYNDTGEGWVDISTPPGADAGVVSWSHTITDMTSQGNRHVQVRVSDVNAAAYGADASFDANLATTYGWNESPSVAFFIDNGPPALDLTGPTIGQKFNTNQFTLTGSSTDTNGLQDITVWVDDNDNQVRDPGETTTLTGPPVAATAMITGFTYTIQSVGGTDFTLVGAPSNTVGTTFVATGPGSGGGMLNNTPLTYDETQYTINKVISSFSNATKTVKAVQVTSFDVSGASTERDLSIVYDPTPPTVTFNAPADSSTVNGTIKISGLADDNYQLSKVYYNVSAAAAAPVFPTDYTELVGQTYSWNVNVPTLPLPDGAYKVRVISQDTALNVSTAPAVLNLTVNQASDRPVVSVLTLNTAGTAIQNLLPASLQISGTVSDDDAVDHTRIMIRSRLLGSGTWGAWGPVSGPPGSDVSLATWNHIFTGFTDGQYEFQIRAADTLAGAYGTDTNFDTNLPTTWGWNESPAVQFAVDLNLPTGTILTPAQSSSQNVNVVISGNATDASGIKKVGIAFDTGSGYGADTSLTLTPVAPIAGNPAVSWTNTYDVSSAADGQIFYRVTITDAFDKVRTYEQYFTLDKTAPTIGFDTPTANPDTVTGAYNGALTFRGHADDNIKINKVYYRFSPTDPGAPDASFTGWTLAASTYSWTATFDTTAFNNTVTDQATKLWALSVDGAGNLSTAASLPFTVNQGSDTPVITLTAPTAGQTFDVNAKALGAVTDDDGLATVQVRVAPVASTFAADGSDYVNVTSPATISGKSVNIEHVLSSLADGDYKLQIRARDTNFTSTAATPFNEASTGVVNFSIDTAPPTLALTKITVQDRYGGADRVITTGFNGSYVNNDLTLALQASDASGIASVQVSTDGTTWTNATAQGAGVYSFGLAIPLNQSFDGTKNIQYRATDGHGKVTSALVTLIVDTLAPVVGFTSPASMPALSSIDAPNVNGSVTVLGTVSDSSALASVAITGGTDNVALTNLGNNLGWKVTFNSGLYASGTHSIDQGSNIWRFPVTVNAIDIAGNKSIPANSVGWIDIDPNSDNPIVTVASPAPSSSVSGSFLINGSVVDDDGAQSVLLQIDLNNDGVFGTNGPFPGYLDLNNDGNHTGDFEDETVAKVITVSNGAWSILMNTASELNKSNLVARGLATATGTIGFKVTPVDINGLHGAPQTQTVYIDATAPTISGLAADGTTPTTDPTPATGSLQKNTVTVRALFKDDQSIPSANMQISLDGGSNFVAVSSLAGATISGDVGSGNPYTYRIAIPINTATAVSGGNGDLQISLKVTDQTFKQTTSSLTYHVDNTLPTVAFNTGNFVFGAGLSYQGTPPSETYSFFGGLNSDTNIANNGLSNEVLGQAADTGTISGIDHVNVYFVKSGNFLNPNTGSTTGVTNSVAGDLLYNQAGTVATGVPFTENPSYIMAIDKRTELGQFDTNPSLGDGDGIQESLKSKSGSNGAYDEWLSYFDSTKLPDGPLTVYFVAYDQAGNKRYGSVNGQVTNNPPSMPQVSVNGSVLSASPWKVKTAGTSIPVVLTANDSGTGANIASTGWKLEVLGRYGNSTDVGTLETSYPSWFYGTGGGAVRDFSSKGSGTSLPVTGTVNLTISGGSGQEANFQEGYWYLLRGTATDLDGNVVTLQFYVRINNTDSTRPIVKTSALVADNFDDFGQTSLVTGHIEDKNSIAFNATVTSTSSNSNVTASGLVNNAFIQAGWTATIGADTRTISTFTTATGNFTVTSPFTSTPSGAIVIRNPALLSGSVKLTGKVYDDSAVNSVNVYLSTNEGSTFTLLGTAALTDPDPSNSVVNGYAYSWNYTWDTSAVSGVANGNVVLGVDASDNVGAGTRALKPVNVVPYITSITDTNGLSTDVLRGSTGKYSVAQDGSNQIVVNGYNLGNTSLGAKVAAAASTVSGTAASPSVTWVSNSQVKLSKTSILLNKSGYLAISVNGVLSINNVNDNTQTRNIESTFNPTTTQWTDDRYLWVWGTTQVNISTYTGPGSITNYYYPDMVMNGSQPEFSFTDESVGNVNYTTSDTAATKRTGFRLNRYATLGEATVSSTLQRFILTSFDSTYGANSTGTGHLEVTGFGDQGNDGTMSNTFSPSSGPDDGGTLRWSTIQGNDYYDGTQTNNTDRKWDRYPYPKMITQASSVTGGASIYAAYFDASTYRSVFQNLNFVSFRMTGARAGNLTYSSQDYDRSIDVVSIPGTDNGRSSKYFDMTKIGSTGIAVAYYDPSTTSLKLAYSTNAFNATGVAGTDNLTNREITNVSITNATKTNYSATASGSTSLKYFKIYGGTNSYLVYFDNTTTQNAALPAGQTGTFSIRVNVNGAAASTAGITTATMSAILAAYPDVFDISVVSGSTTSFNIAARDATTTTSTTTNLNAATAVGTATVARHSTATWNTITIDASANVGQYVSMTTDGTNYLYLSYYDFDNANLKFARVNWNSGTPLVDGTVAVDNYLSAGSWTKIALINDVNMTGIPSAQPFISYYSDSYNGTKKPIRLTFPRFNAATSSLSNGANGDDSYTGSWEVITVPAISAPQGGSDKFQHTQLGTYTNSINLPVVGWVGDKPEYAKLQPNN